MLASARTDAPASPAPGSGKSQRVDARPVIEGLSSAEAQARLRADGANEVEGSTRRTIPMIVIGIMSEPMFLLLVAGGATYFVVGDVVEALILAVFACASVALTIVQEVRSERALDALRALAAPRARVVRDGAAIDIAAREVVRDDVLLLDAGDRIAADATLLDDAALEVDESILTGESVPVAKVAGGAATLMGGTLITRGSGRARVIETGMGSAIGRIAGALASLDVTAPRLRQETRAVVRVCGIAAAAVSLFVIAIHGFFRGDWSGGMLSGIAVGMALLPEEFAVVLAVYLAMGARRIASVGVLTRRAAAIETIGAATVLCTDKTGTLTENRMRVERWWTQGDAPVALDELKNAAAWACEPASADPMDTAILAGAAFPPHGKVIRTYGLRRDLLAVAVAYALEDGRGTVAVKGAPEAVLSLCRGNDADMDQILSQVAAMAAEGFRVLAVGQANCEPDAPPAALDSLHCRFLGLVGLIDPVRPDVPEAVERLRHAGIRVIMITGDHPATARAIARQAGIEEGEVLSGADLRLIPADRLEATLAGLAVLARVSPDQKVELVQALQGIGEVVAMIGDGVNDAPALRAADIGVAMGRRGTAVAREAGDIVLLDDRFSSIPDAVRLGRRIYDNIRKAAGFIVSVHVPIAGLTVLPLITGAPILLGPLHIALLEIVIDPVCALVFEAEPEPADVMTRPPRSPGAKLFDRYMLVWSGVLGGLAMAAAALVGMIGERIAAPDQARTAVFLVLVGALVGLVQMHLGFRRPAGTARRYLAWRVLAAVTGLLTVIFSLPFARLALGFGLPDLTTAMLAGAGLAMFALAGFAVTTLTHVETRTARRA